MLICGGCGSKKKTLLRKDLDLKVLYQKYRFTKPELVTYKQRFDRMARGNGFTLDDFRENMGLLGMKSTRLIADRIFDVMNKSRSGKVVIEEYLSYMDILMHGTPQEKAQQSFKLIKNSKEGNITYNDFASWLINVWKMYNTLTGSEVSATQEDIRYYFDQLDTKHDDMIDLEEYTSSMSNNENLFEWFDFVNKKITDKINPPNIEQKKPEVVGYKETLEDLENEIRECLEIIDGGEAKTPIKRFRAISHSSIKLSFRKESANDWFNAAKTEIFEKEDDVIDSSSEATPINASKSNKWPKIKLTESALENNNSHNNQNKIGEVKEKLIHILAKINDYKQNSPDEANRNSVHEPAIRQAPSKRRETVIHWGDEDWNLILNMMLGIQKAVKSIAANIDATVDATQQEFLEKAKYNLLPANNQGVKQKTYKLRDYAPSIFERIRRFFGISAYDYVKSLGVEKIMNSLMVNEFSSLEGQCSSGKSGSFFYFSDDGKYILKTLKREEYLFLKKILPDYYLHVMENPHTLVARFFGFHKLIASKGKMLYFTVLGNVFQSGHELTEVYDLKGSTYGRFTNKGESSSVARKDLDFVQEGKKIILGGERKKLLMQQIERDCELLQSLKIIDYSLLLGIHEVKERGIHQKAASDEFVRFAERDEGGMVSSDGKYIYFMGIIDILTYYGSKKKIEHAIKTTVHGKAAISCAPPNFYAQRFISFLDTLIE
ncbi:unnamed protein product [Blepharisma stoltei]|uniref:Phosphatidylinositol-4-phosphate 5-kinase n=1 Tax=Blepharisma stoltei TaxID=1481888 RepID=A0AAU9K859_9CILI|nr:unnamed protein product [Blepharisma stoltei]